MLKIIFQADSFFLNAETVNKVLSHGLIVFALVVCSTAFAQKDANNLRKTMYNTAYARFNINNISTRIENNGSADLNGMNSDFRFPKTTMKAAIYCSGFAWGGKVNNEVKIGGSLYSSSMSPGKIHNDGTVDDPNSEIARVYRVRRDFKTADLSMESIDEAKGIQEIYYQYEKDWNEWPANYGAPFEDVNNNGIYEPSVDYPGVTGADQTLWFVANDLDSNETKRFFNSKPIGIEMRVTVWGYNSEPPLGNALFKKYEVINKSKNNLDSMYFGIWSDPDLGDASDDYVGCDTTLNLGFVYNADDYDHTYKSLNTPSIGFCLLQGPIVDGAPADSAYFKNKIIRGKKNLPMTAFSYPYKGAGEWGEVTLDSQLYYYLQGKTRSGNLWPIPDQFGGGATRFLLSGDPVSLSGFFDGVQIRAGDRRLMVCTGPFNMATSDTQEVVFMQVAAGADGKTDYLSAINLMKYYTNILTNQYFTPGMKLSSTERVNVKTTVFNGGVLLNWGEDRTQIDRI